MKKIISKIKYVLNGEDAYSPQPIGVWLIVVLCLIVLRYFFYDETNYYLNELYLYLSNLL